MHTNQSIFAANMPRDLSLLSQATENTLQSMTQLSSQNKEAESNMTADHDQDSDTTEYMDELGQSNARRDPLHPYTQTLSLSDIESCIRLEDAAFPSQERCTREKVSLRSQNTPFSGCGDLLVMRSRGMRCLLLP